LRIGLMLRALDEHGGVGVYTRYLTEELLSIDRRNEYVLFYRSADNLGRFGHHPNVTERVVRAPGKALWDQVAIPWHCWREKIDVVFHPKFTVPFLAPCRTMMVLHGAGWFLTDFFGKWDVRYIRAVMPLYLRRADRVLSVSNVTTDTFNEIFDVPADRIHTVYFGPGKHFRRIDDPDRLRAVRARYSLPDRFVLTLTKLGGDERKNFGGVLSAYRAAYPRIDHALVVGGKGCERLRDDYAIPADGWGGDVYFPGWIDQEDLPAVYSLADGFLYPSKMEAFPIPITEALATGTPIVTSSRNGLLELAGDAALMVDADDAEETAEALVRVLTDPELAARLREAGLERSRRFSWEACGRTTLRHIEQVGAGVRRSRDEASQARAGGMPEDRAGA
jgi:glycosyltransferase involved in cell wall biosynthesis